MSTRKPKPEKGIQRRGDSYRAEVFDSRTGQKIRKTFPTLAAARNWRQDTQSALRKGAILAPTATTVRQAADDFLEGIQAGRYLSRSGRRYKPQTVRDYRANLNRYVLDHFGDKRLSDVRRADVQEWVDELVGRGLAGSTVKNAADPLRRIFDRALKRDLIAVDPTDGIDWPSSASKRDRIASPDEGRKLLAALPETDRPVWATAMYAGLRSGELRALRWDDVDLAANIIRVERGWDDVEGAQDGKTDSARRRVPLIPELRKVLVAHQLATGRRGADLVFGRTTTEAFYRSTVRSRALRAWKAAKLQPIGLHECRHTFASLLIASGVNIKAVSTYMGHAQVSITLDLYGHLMPNAEAEAAEQLQAYLDRPVSGGQA